jgi:hypothetical protein
MLHETIDTDEIIGIFRQFLKTSSTTRVLYIIGEAKLGKSHLLTKVFPVLAQQEYQARHAVIDLRHPQTISEILSLTSSQLDGMCCTHFKDAEREWTNQPKVRMEHVFLILSSLTLSAEQEYNDLYKNMHYLTTQFIKDLETYDDQPLLLLIDHMDNATEEIQAWLINTFLVRISLLKHIWIVVAGHSVPEPHGRYAASCLRYQLHPVTEEDAYIAYCHRLKVTLLEQSIRDFAFYVDYRPGMFVDYVVTKFQQRR